MQDLTSAERLSMLHGEAVAKGLAPSGERGLLELVGLAEHARRYGTKNAPGLFARLLRDQRWNFITQDDEDLARRCIREHREGPERNCQRGSSVSAAGEPMPGRVGELLGRFTEEPTRLGRDPSERMVAHLDVAGPSTGAGSSTKVVDDARYVGLLLRTLAARGVRDEALAFRELSKVKPEWTEARWTRARWGMTAGAEPGRSR